MKFPRHAFTLVELLVVIAIIGVLIALLLPAVQAAREAARRMQCANNLKQLSLACHLHNDTHKTLPNYGNAYERSNWLVYLCPFIEQQAIWDMIEAGGKAASVSGSYNYAKGVTNVSSWSADYKPWHFRSNNWFCPSDPNVALVGSDATSPGGMSYRACIGDKTFRFFKEYATDTNDSALGANQIGRGVFSVDLPRDFSSVTDGTSNTFLLSETLASAIGDKTNARLSVASGGWPGWTPAGCIAKLDPNDLTRFTAAAVGEDLKGRRWGCSRYVNAAFTTILGPNSPSCLSEDNVTRGGLFPTSSNHPGGANHSLVDGSVRFVSETVDTGSVSDSYRVRNSDGSASGESPFGVYGAMGSLGGGESKSL